LLTAFIGLRFLIAGMRALNEYSELRQLAAPVAAVPDDSTQDRDQAAEKSTALAEIPAELRISTSNTSSPPASMTLLYVWILLFGFVGTQLAWTLRPFFGSPGEPVEIFRNIEGTFYSDVLRTIGHLLGG
jgi:hypothetical protein